MERKIDFLHRTTGGFRLQRYGSIRTLSAFLTVHCWEPLALSASSVLPSAKLSRVLAFPCLSIHLICTETTLLPRPENFYFWSSLIAKLKPASFASPLRSSFKLSPAPRDTFLTEGIKHTQPVLGGYVYHLQLSHMSQMWSGLLEPSHFSRVFNFTCQLRVIWEEI